MCEPILRDTIYLGGAWTAAAGSGILEVVNPATEELLGRVPEGSVADVDRAVEGARTAFETWSCTSAEERAAFLESVAEHLAGRRAELVEGIAREIGAPLRLARSVQVGLPITVLRETVGLLRSYAFEEELGTSLILREPIGVVGCITPWNFPLHQVVAKVASALAAGCTVVVKPSEIAPLSAFALAEAVDAAGLPPGVFQLVPGRGETVGEAIAAHPGIDMVSFTGSTRAGRRVAELAAATVKRVTQELGGKSANVILEDADLERAVEAGVRNAFFNSGQTCSAWTRMLVPRARQGEAIEIARRVAESFVPGDPLADGTTLGPLVSARQQVRVRGYIRQGVDEGARLVTGGAEMPEGLDRGYFIRPTVFAEVENGMTLAREEIFGPVLSILPHDGDDDAVRLANDTPYGLAGAVWSADEARALAVAKRLRTGQVDINGGRFNPSAPFGGYKQSGNGREFGRFGLEEFLEVKAVQR